MRNNNKMGLTIQLTNMIVDSRICGKSICAWKSFFLVFVKYSGRIKCEVLGNSVHSLEKALYVSW